MHTLMADAELGGSGLDGDDTPMVDFDQSGDWDEAAANELYREPEVAGDRGFVPAELGGNVLRFARRSGVAYHAGNLAGRKTMKMQQSRFTRSGWEAIG